ncbi:MAG: UDP-N-acetylglucosamine--N-acetylmuramyl-(pentapeptide) pyrophosphoryl-undecaprenol N-acetylglucosamine transferase [Christensenellaceae bacterium]|jgi:UDP-N-acetylglucosamine--N-acetylmuramyl-(pentapeptide) pyrophosphoryl-undecaprenol N-acetylglucosamine transferase|nr:UDP-N-acetylglucosamine--N-acetylmuramyl-(pentapeptide) pyrophosphoryl-undecaprenol N-acetylglucosamine transferase [Christensenellaceae bacterium]
MGKTLILTGGGTAGHIMPNLAIAEFLFADFERIIYLGREEGLEKDLVEKFGGIEYFGVKTAKFKRSFSLDNLKIPFALYKGIKEAKEIILRENVSHIFSKGGFVSLPVVLAGLALKKKNNIKIIAHESDASFGIANKLVAKKVDAILTTFPIEKKYKNQFCLGSPIRQELYKGDAKRVYQNNFDPKKKNLLVVGGSLGSGNINAVLRESRAELLKNFNIYHIAGTGKLTDADKGISGYIAEEFSGDIADLYAWADFVVSRAGSNAVCEILSLKKRALFIPLEKQSRGDQVLNCEFVISNNLGAVLREKDLTAESFAAAILALQKSKFKNINLDGTKKIAEFIASE